MKSRELGRLLTAMVTPFDAEGQVDHARAGELALRLIAEGCDGVVVSGTTGESPTLSDDEKVALFHSVVKAVDGRGTVIAGTGTNDTRVACALSVAAAEAGCDGLLVVNPYYNKPDQAGLRAHFTAVAEATALPVILYNHPGRTGVTIEPATMAELAQLPTVVGVKDSSGNLDLVTAYRLAAGPGFVIWSGDDPLTLPYMAIGAHGVISVSAHVAARDLKAMLEAWARGDVAEARRLHERTYAIGKALFCAPSPAPTKHALATLGFPVGGVRLPLVGCDARAQATVDEAVAAVRPSEAPAR
ncbi:MAG: 4-hydroxy-tetrahydrodipicolinate synthase [Candidatus Sericytochromatia bacterium]|nr:4-hydroxy-tetrahydrodipicolinate synthase [Candidatus Sericytochromatia bacterium]